MTPAAERVLRLAMTLDDPNAMRELIRAALEADAPTPDPPRSRKAQNQKAYRDRKNGRASGPALPFVTDESANAVTENGNANGNGVTGFVTGSLPPTLPGLARGDKIQNPPSFREDPERKGGDLTRTGARGVADGVTARDRSVTASVTASLPRPLPVTNASDDGAFGMAVESWRQGVSGVTKRPISPTPGLRAQLGRALRETLPDDATRTEKARESGAAFAAWAVEKGCAISVLKYLDWLATPSPVPSSTVVAGPQAREYSERHEASMREAEANRAAPPAELLEVVGLKPKKGAA